MLLIPKNTKYLKFQIRNKRLGKLSKQQLSNNSAIIATQQGFLCNMQAEHIKSSLRRNLKKRLKVSFNFVANSTITKKPNETRMGKGKAEMSYWISTFKPGQVILSIKDNKSVPVDLSQLTKKIRRTLSFTSSTFIKKSRWIL